MLCSGTRGQIDAAFHPGSVGTSTPGGTPIRTGAISEELDDHHGLVILVARSGPFASGNEDGAAFLELTNRCASPKPELPAPSRVSGRVGLGILGQGAAGSMGPSGCVETDHP